MTSRLVRLVSRAVSFGLVCVATNLRASPGDLFGTGSESVSKAGTGVATATGPAAAHLNPARLGGGGRPRFRVGYGAAHFDLVATSRGDEFDLGDQTGSADFGLWLPLRLAAPFADRFGIGLNATTPSSVIARVRIFDAETPQFPLLAHRADSLNLDVALGVELPAGFELGAGTMLQASLSGSVAIQAGGSGAVASTVDDELVLIAAPLLGAAWSRDDVHVGVVFRGEIKSEFDLLVTLDDLGQIVLPPLDVTGVAQYDPPQWQFEVAWSPRRWELTAGVSYKLWSELHSFRGPTVSCPDDVESCGEPERVSLGTSDTWVPRVALEHRFSLPARAEGSLRLGYFFEPSPLPAQTGTTNQWDNPRHAVTAGYAVELLSPLPRAVAAFAVQRHFLVTRRHLDRAADETAAFGDVSTSGAVWAVGTDLEVPF